MSFRRQALEVASPGVTASRWATDELYVGLKEHYAITRIDRGLSRFWSRGRVWESHPGLFRLTQPGDVHRDLSREGIGVFQIVMLPRSFVESVTGKLARVEPVLSPDDERALPFARLHAAIDGRAGRLAMDVAITEAVAAIGSIGHSTSSERTRPVRRALDYLQARLGDSVTLDDLADHAGLDKYHLCRAFRAQIGMPPHAYLTRLRIVRAKELLRDGARPGDVAARVGLYDQSQLHRHFRRIEGTTPGRFARAATTSRT